MKQRRVSLLFSFAAVAAVSFAIIASRADAGPNRIAYLQVDRDINLYLADSTGSNIRLAAAGGKDPRWSPDGEWLAYAATPPGTNSAVEIYKISKDGERKVKVTDLAAGGGRDKFSSRPFWSADGSRLVFEALGNNSDTAPTYSNLFVVNSDGSAPRKITNGGEDPAKLDYHASEWSPDDKKVSFYACSRRFGWCRIGTVNPDGTGRRFLTSDDKSAFSPVWSGDGSKIAYVQGRSGSNIFVMNPDGSAKKQLTEMKGSESEAAWIPGTKTLSFAKFRDGGQKIFTISSDGTGQKLLFDGDNGAPSWRADGKVMVVRVLGGRAKLVTADRDGGNQQVILDNGNVILYPSWGGSAVQSSPTTSSSP